MMNFGRDSPKPVDKVEPLTQHPAGDFPRRPTDTGQCPSAPRHGGQQKHGFVRRLLHEQDRQRRIAMGIEVGFDPG
jgi:hypothetical protein